MAVLDRLQRPDRLVRVGVTPLSLAWELWPRVEPKTKASQIVRLGRSDGLKMQDDYCTIGGCINGY